MYKDAVMLFYVAVYKEDVQDYWAEVPALIDCYSQGDTVSDTLHESCFNIQVCVAAMRAENRHAKIVQKPLSKLKAMPDYAGAAWHAVKVDLDGL